MSPEAKDQVTRLTEKADAFAAAHGATIVSLFNDESKPILKWLDYLNTSQRTGVANALLDGAVASIRESAACAALGLMRPTLFSMRTMIDLMLGWLYFKDHPVEWATVNQIGDGYKLKRELLDYLAENFPGTRARFALLKDVCRRQVEDPYRLLSAHIHAQSGPVLPSTNNLSDVVCTAALGAESSKLFGNVTEYVSDLLASVYALKWSAMPAEIKTGIEQRLKNKKGHLEKFFAGI